MAIMPSMFTSVPGEMEHVLAPAGVRIPTRGLSQSNLVETLQTDALTIRITERDYNAVTAEGNALPRQLKYTLVQFQLRIERLNWCRQGALLCRRR